MRSGSLERRRAELRRVRGSVSVGFARSSAVSVSWCTPDPGRYLDQPGRKGITRAVIKAAWICHFSKNAMVRRQTVHKSRAFVTLMASVVHVNGQYGNSGLSRSSQVSLPLLHLGLNDVFRRLSLPLW